MNHNKPGLREELPGGHTACWLPRGRELTAGRVKVGLSRSKAGLLTWQMGASSACRILLFSCSMVVIGAGQGAAGHRRLLPVSLPRDGTEVSGCVACKGKASGWFTLPCVGCSTGLGRQRSRVQPPPPALVVLAQQSHACKVRSESPGRSTVHFLTCFTCALLLTVLETRLAKVLCNAICNTAATDLGFPQCHLLRVQGSGRDFPT